MCDDCKDEDGILRLLRISPNDRRDPITVAKRRLQCYYQCVTQDVLDSDDDDDDIWEPED